MSLSDGEEKDKGREGCTKRKGKNGASKKEVVQIGVVVKTVHPSSAVE